MAKYRELLTAETVMRVPMLIRLRILLTGRIAFTCRHPLERPLSAPPGPSHVAVTAFWPLQGPLRVKPHLPVRVAD